MWWRLGVAMSHGGGSGPLIGRPCVLRTIRRWFADWVLSPKSRNRFQGTLFGGFCPMGFPNISQFVAFSHSGGDKTRRVLSTLAQLRGQNDFGSRNVECGMWNVECGMWNVECGMWNVECGMWNVECGMEGAGDCQLPTDHCQLPSVILRELPATEGSGLQRTTKWPILTA